MGYYRLLSGTMGLTVLALSAGSALAHHSFAMFDRDPGKEATVSGALKEFDFSNPHGWLRIYALDGPNKGAVWSFEMAAVNQLKAYGWTPETVKPGDTVTVAYYPLRFGSFGGEFISVKLPDGRLLKGVNEGDRGFPTSR